MQTRLGLLVVAAALVLSACGGDSAEETTPTTASPTTTAAPTTTTSSTTTTTTVAELEAVTFTGVDGVVSEITDTSRIVSLAGDITETIFALDAGEKVAAIDVTTTYPPQALALPRVGFGQQLAAEAVLSFGPTLVLGDQLSGPSEVLDQIRQAGVPVVILESQTDFDGTEKKITDIATILGLPEAGADLAATVGEEIQAAVARAAGVTEQLRVAYIYARGPQALLLFGQGLPTQAMIEGANAVDALVDVGVRGAPPLTAETLIAAAPDVIVLPEAGLAALGGLEAFKAIPGVAETPAGQNDAFLVYDEGYFFSLGPRAGEALNQFVGDLYPSL